MKLKTLFVLLLTLVWLGASAQEGGIRGKVVSRNGRVALSDVKVKIGDAGRETQTDPEGRFVLERLPQGDHTLYFSALDFEELSLRVKVGDRMQEIGQIVLVPVAMQGQIDDSIFSELDTDASSSDVQALPSSLNASKDLFNNIASYRFSEMRFNVRGYDSQYTDVYLNGIRFNDALTGYGPWSLWSGLNDATRNQEHVAGLTATEYGIGGVGGVTHINARASQMRKGFRASIANGNSMYRLRAMVSYASGMQDNGWAYAFSVSTRQGGNGYVDGVYYNSYGYFASVEKRFGLQHRLALTLLAAPSQRGAQQASTEEAYDLFGSHYYNPNVGYQMGELRNSRVRRTHEPIVMLNYTWDISERTRLNAAASVRFGKNGYSALTWKDGADPRADYYRYLPSYYLQKALQATTETGRQSLIEQAARIRSTWTGRLDFDNFYRTNYRVDPTVDYVEKGSFRSNYIIEERHTDQLDFNAAASLVHQFRSGMRLVWGLNLRANKTEYYDRLKDLLGGDYWLDVDKFAERDMGSDPLNYQNDLDYYRANGHARVAVEGDKISYDYDANLRDSRLWLLYTLNRGGFELNLGGEAGYTSMWRTGRVRKGLFPDNSLGDSEKLDYLTYRVKTNLGYRFSSAHSVALNFTYLQDAPKFQSAFVSPRTRNQVTPGLKEEHLLGADLTYNLNLPWLQARLSGYYTRLTDQSKVISFYDDTQSSFTNFAMSGIDKRFYGVELGFSVPVYNGLALQGALSWGDYTYTSNPDFVQIVDNSADVKLIDRVAWEGSHVESTPQLALNIGLNYRGPHNWFASFDFNYYDDIYLSMNPMYRTSAATQGYLPDLQSGDADRVRDAYEAVRTIRRQEKFDPACTLSASIGKNWYVHRIYTIGFSLQVNNLLNDQDIRTGGYEQMRMNRVRDREGNTKYTRFDSKYFYLLGTTYYLNLYFRF